MRHHRTSAAPRGLLGALVGAAVAFCVLPACVMFLGVLLRPAAFSVLADAERMGRLFGTTACVAGGAVVFAMVLGAPLGFLLFRTDVPLRRGIIFGAILTACLPLYVVLTCWMALGGMPLWTGSRLGAAWIMGMAYVPLVTLLTGVGFRSADATLEEQALLETDARGVLAHVVLPQASWALAAAAGVVTALSLSMATVTDILNVRALADEILVQFQLSAEPWRAVALTTPLFAFLVALVALLARALRGYGAAAEAGRGPAPFRLGRLRLPCALFVLGMGALYLFPFGALARATGSIGQLLQAYGRCAEELWGTLTLTPLAATLCVLLAVVVARALVRLRPCRAPLAAALALLAATPEAVTGVGLAAIFNRAGIGGRIYDSRAILVIAYVIRALPFAVLALLPALRRVSPDIEDAAALDGCDGPSRLLRVILPLIWRSVVVAWFLVLVLAMGEVGASVLVAPPGPATLTIHFYTQIHAGVYPDTAATCLILLGVVSVPAAAVALLLGSGFGGRGGRRREPWGRVSAVVDTVRRGRL